MIEYFIKAVASVLVISFAIVKSRRNRPPNPDNFIGVLKEWKEIGEFIIDIPRWFEFYENFNANKELLHERKNRLQVRLNDVRMDVEDQEFRTGRRRKREVDNWLSSTETICNEVQALLQEMATTEIMHFFKFICLAWLGNVLEKKIKEVDDLFDSGDFGEVLSSARQPLTLLTSSLVGNAAHRNIERVKEWLCSGVTKVGVHGIKGIGKTELVKHVHNQLSENFHVFMIQVVEKDDEYDLQSKIAQEIGINLQENDKVKRAAMLHRALQQKKFVLILDGVGRYFSENEVGIPLEPTKGKMIITSRSPIVCHKIGCGRNMIAVDPLSYEEALKLFREKVNLDEFDGESRKVDLARKIVMQCKGVPLKIIDTAIQLRNEEHDIFWAETLHEMVRPNVSRTHSIE